MQGSTKQILLVPIGIHPIFSNPIEAISHFTSMMISYVDLPRFPERAVSQSI